MSTSVNRVLRAFRGQRTLALLKIFESIVSDLTALNTKAEALIVDAALANTYRENSTKDNGQIADGTTDGKLKTVAAVDFAIAGALYTKAATDDLWDLSAETDTTGAQYRAYWLYLDSSGTASIAAGTNAASAAAALAALPAITATKSVIGVYVAGLSTDFNGAAGLAAQGTIYNGMPATIDVTAATSTLGTVSDTTE